MLNIIIIRVDVLTEKRHRQRKVIATFAYRHGWFIDKHWTAAVVDGFCQDAN